VISKIKRVAVVGAVASLLMTAAPGHAAPASHTTTGRGPAEIAAVQCLRPTWFGRVAAAPCSELTAAGRLHTAPALYTSATTARTVRYRMYYKHEGGSWRQVGTMKSYMVRPGVAQIAPETGYARGLRCNGNLIYVGVSFSYGGSAWTPIWAGGSPAVYCA
jgi:hypothetical protein